MLLSPQGSNYEIGNNIESFLETTQIEKKCSEFYPQESRVNSIALLGFLNNAKKS